MSNNNDKYFWEAYPDAPIKYEEIFDVVQSDAAYEKFTSAIGLGELLEKPEGEDLQADAPIESYTIICKNRSWGRLVRFSYETVKDTKKIANLLMNSVGSWGKMVPITKEKWYVKFINLGAQTAGDDINNNTITGVVDDPTANLCYDGKALFSTSHKSKVGTNYSNYDATNNLTHTNLKSTYITFSDTNARDERDERFTLSPNVLIHPPALRFTAMEILNSTLIPDSMDNDTNVLRAIVDPMEWSYLTDTTAWLLGVKKMGLMATDREDVSLDFWQDETSMDYFARCFTRFGGVITNWRYWYRSN